MSNNPATGPGERIAAALRRSPIHIDPAFASAVPPARRAALTARMRRSPIPIHLVIVPLVTGGDWSDSEQLATVVHARLGRDGAYVTLGDGVSDTLRAYQWGGTAESRDNTRDAASAVFHQEDMEDAPLAARLTRCVELIAGGRGTEAYEAATADLRPARSAAPSPAAGTPAPAAGGGGVPWELPTGLAVAALAGAALVRLRTRRARQRSDDRFLLPRRVFAVAGQASEDELRAQAEREVVSFGELLDESTTDTTDQRSRELMTRALDAYQAAARTLDTARGLPDLAGALVLVDIGRDAYASARARADGRQEPRPNPLCFFNPLHGDAAEKITWRAIGTRRKLTARACAACATAARARETPDFLLDRDGDREIPYVEADGVWAETGYGQFRDDLVQRVLRGDR